MKANLQSPGKLIDGLINISYEKIQSNFLVFAEGSNHVLNEMDDLFGIQNPSAEPESGFFYKVQTYRQLGRVANNPEM